MTSFGLFSGLSLWKSRWCYRKKDVGQYRKLEYRDRSHAINVPCGIELPPSCYYSMHFAKRSGPGKLESF